MVRQQSRPHSNRHQTATVIRQQPQLDSNHVQTETMTKQARKHLQVGCIHLPPFTHNYSTVQCSAVQYSTVQYSTVQYSAVQYSTVQYSTVQYSTVQYSAVQYQVQYSTVQCSTTVSTAQQHFSIEQFFREGAPPLSNWQISTIACVSHLRCTLFFVSRHY